MKQNVCACGKPAIKGKTNCHRCKREQAHEKAVEAALARPRRRTLRSAHILTNGDIPALCGHCAFQGVGPAFKCEEKDMDARGLFLAAHEARIKGLCPLVLKASGQHPIMLKARVTGSGFIVCAEP